MTEEKTQTEKEAHKKIEAKPLPVDKEKTKEIEEKMKAEKTDEKKKEKPEVKKIVKKEEAIARGISLPISKKHSMYLCAFIKGKSIDQALADLEKVGKLKLAVPYKGEIPHRKGNMERGRYPVNASKFFINLLKSLKGNAITNGLELDETRIYFGSATWAARPMRRAGRLAKRTNVTTKAKEFPIQMKNNKEKKK